MRLSGCGTSHHKRIALWRSLHRRFDDSEDWLVNLTEMKMGLGWVAVRVDT
jgi:hypothetical protein